MNVEKEFKEIKKRNARVEADKAWETSWERKILIAILTYVVIVIFFLMTGLPNPWINSLVPTLAFLLSTLLFTEFKEMWLKKR